VMSDTRFSEDDSQMEYTGERMVPEAADPATFWEHIYRYRFATRFVSGRKVLDIACGEGYGSAALLRGGAASLVGVDVSLEACEHATRKYGIDARVGDASRIPLPDQSVEVVVSFETIEHISDQCLFIDECQRVLSPGGILVLSTPNRDVYRETVPDNPFHCSEIDEHEFVTLLQRRFKKLALFSQRPVTAPWWSLRGFATDYWRNDTWWWWKMRAVRHLRWRFNTLTCSHLEGEPSSEIRLAPVETILGRDGLLSVIPNPYVVRPRRNPRSERPRYLIAVAQRF
jgi:SAM-dependent methyltransferase